MVSQQSLLLAAVAAPVAYVIGGMPFGYWFVRLSSGQDIRTMGSGNIGATNVQRSAGTKAGLIVLALDIFKGFLAVWAAALITQHSALGLAAGTIGVVVGHCYPVFLNFKGGKAVACYVGAALYLGPIALLVTLVIFVGIAALSKYISLASVLSALIFPFVYWAIYLPASELIVAFVLASALIIYRHKGNIERLRAGTENVFSLRGRKT